MTTNKYENDLRISIMKRGLSIAKINSYSGGGVNVFKRLNDDCRNNFSNYVITTHRIKNIFVFAMKTIRYE